MSTPAQRLDKWIWPAIFVGIVLGAFGLSLDDGGGLIGWALIAVGAGLIVAGSVMIWLRSRIDD